MAVEVILPKVDMDMSTGRISSWLVEEGATVKKGDLLFEIETDKAAMEIDSPAAGIVRNITGKEGVDIPVGQVVAWIYEEGEAVADAPASAPAEAAAEAPAKAEGPAPVEAAAPVAAAPAATAEASSGVRASPLARRLAKEAGLDLSAIAGSGPKGR
ncbi:biotin/lipoyl-containing protein, partial [Nitratireductor rhodophyticola]|uniref:biotin/lipoyl-containing protein n=1 Tax=Nitratireductor rhodophyticola TaxID=2854036 RepID=UPI00300B5C27